MKEDQRKQIYDEVANQVARDKVIEQIPHECAREYGNVYNRYRWTRKPPISILNTKSDFYSMNSEEGKYNDQNPYRNEEIVIVVSFIKVHLCEILNGKYKSIQ